jgi:hypothetical protein
MENNYWTKDRTRQEIITKNQIINSGNFALFATYYNLIDKQGLSFLMNFENDLAVEKLYKKNNFKFLVLENDDLKELYILPNEKLNEYIFRVVSKIDSCKNQNEVLELLIDEMH